MFLTKKAKYAIMAIIDIAKENNNIVPISEIVSRQEISHSYLEKILLKLKKSNILTSFKGINGGYKLKKEQKDIKLIEIIDAMEEKIKITSCKNGKTCISTGKCSCHKLWINLEGLIKNYFKNITVKDVIENKINL